MLLQPGFNRTGPTNRYTAAGKIGQTTTLADSLKTAPKPQDLIASTTQELIKALNTNGDTRTTLSIIQKQFDIMETYCNGLPAGTVKTAVTIALRTAHRDFATALLKKMAPLNASVHMSSSHSSPTHSATHSRSSSFSSTGTPPMPVSISEKMTENLPFFTQSLVGRMTVARHLANQTLPLTSGSTSGDGTDDSLSSTLYMPDMAGAQKDTAFATSLALYPHGLLAAAKNNDLSKADTALDMPATLDILQTFAQATHTSTLPIDRPETYAPFADTHTQELLNGNLDPQILLDHPALETAIKQALPAKLTSELAKAGYASNLLQDTPHGTQWETQFAGFEKEVFSGVCQALDPNKTPDMPLLTLAMSVAEALNTPDAYDTIINKLSDAQLEQLFSPQTPPQITAMLQHNKAWQSALGKRLDILEIAEQKQQLHAVLNQEVKLNEAKPFVKTQQRAHVGNHTDLHISPRLMLPILTSNPVDQSHPQSDFAKAVDSFCANPTGPKAPNINTLYQQAKDLVAQKDTFPAPLQMRITLIIGIHANLKTPVADTGENLGNTAWEYKAPIEIKTSAKSSHQQALQSLQNGSKSAVKPNTLQAWVQFFQKDGDAKVAKYTARRDQATGNAKNLYTDLVANSEKFGKTMTQVDKALTARDIAAVRNTLQTAMATTATALTALEAKVETSKEGKAALKTHKEVLTEMIQVYRRLDHGIANSIAKTPPPVSTPTFAKVPSSVTHATRIAQPVAANLLTELAPSLRTYEAGMSATKASDIDAPIATLKAAITDLTDKQTKLEALLKLVETTIPAALGQRNTATAALGDNPVDGTRPTQAGLYQNLFDANTEDTRLGQETAARQRELAPLEQEVTRLTTKVLPAAEERVGTTTETRDEIQQQIEALEESLRRLEGEEAASEGTLGDDSALLDSTREVIDRDPEAIRTEIANLRIQLGTENQNVDHARAAKDLLESTTIPEAEALVTEKNREITQAQQAKDAQLVIYKAIEAHIRTQEGFINTYDQLVAERNLRAQTLGFAEVTTDSTPYESLTAGDIEAKQQETTRDLTAETQKQAYLRTRITDLETRQKELRHIEEAGSFLGETQSSCTNTYGDALNTLIEKNTAAATSLKDIRTHILNGEYGDALTKLKDSALTHLSFDLKTIISALENYAADKSALKTHAAPISITQKAARFAPLKSSSQQQALKATGGSVKTLEDHLTFAKNHADARLAKASSRGSAPDPIINSYADCINGVGSTPSLKTLLMNGDPQSRQTAIDNLQNTIADINLSFSSTDAKAIRIKDEIISSLNTLKTEIEKATSTVATPRKQVLASQLRAALTAMSDVPASVASSSSIPAPTAKIPFDFYTAPNTSGATASLTSASRIPTAKAALEKRGLYYNPQATWDSYAGNDAKKHLFFAHIYANAAINTVLTGSDNTIVNFKTAILALNATDRAPLQALYDLASTLSDTTHPDYNTRLQTFRDIYQKITKLPTTNAVDSTKPPSSDDLQQLYAHTTAIAQWMENTSAPIPKDATQQALLMEVGLLMGPSKPAVTVESETSFTRLYRHRPLTDGLISDLNTTATAYGDTPEFIGCMGDALGQALRLPASDTTIEKLATSAKEWSASLQHLGWTSDPEKRLQHSIRTYQQANELYIRLQAENKTSPETTAMATTLQHLYADIQQGVAAIGINNAITNTAPADLTEKLKLVSQVRIPIATGAPSTAPLSRRPQPAARPTATESPLSREMKVAFTGTPTLTRVPDAGLYTKFKVGTTEYSVMAYKSDAPANSPKNALQALWGTPSVESFATSDGTLNMFSSMIGDADIATNIRSLTSAHVPVGAQVHFRNALRNIALEVGKQTAPNILADNAAIKTSLGLSSDIPASLLDWLNNDTVGVPADLNIHAQQFITEITNTPKRALHPHELLFVAAIQEKPLAIVSLKDDGTYHSLGNSSLTSAFPLTMIEYRNGEYHRWEPTGHHQPKTVGASAMRPTRVNVPQYPARMTSVGATYGAIFDGIGENTNITCWLEAAIYSAAYDPQQALPNKLNSAITAAATNNRGLSTEKIAFLTQYRNFLATATPATRGGQVPGITKLNTDAQALYFHSAVEQQDPMDFLRMVHADLDTLLAETDTYTRTETQHVQTSVDWREGEPEANTYMLHNKRVRLTGGNRAIPTQVTPAKSVPIHISLGNLAAGHSLQAALTTESGSDSHIEDSTTNEVVTQKTIGYAAADVAHLPNECHITVSRDYDKTTHRLGKAPLLSPTPDSTRQYVTIPATINGTRTDVRYNISQIIAHSGYTGGGHYVCYFQPDPTKDIWYKKSSNGNAATKLGDYAAVSAELTPGDLTYTYMGVKA